jgi:2,3-bisphosphoglycerate-independent phosphoglycerate mutase
MQKSKVILIIMDGWGIAENPAVSAIDLGNTPFYDEILRSYPHTKLNASGLFVGLPDGQMGNSEVGHMNIGAGRIVYQDLVRLNLEIENGHFAQNPKFGELISYCRSNRKPLHLMGLLSDGGVHSHIDHLKGIIRYLAEAGISEVFVHAFMDGRDTDPHGGETYIEALETVMKSAGTGKIASVIGRYYAMDRDKRWERVKKAWDLLVEGKGKSFASATEAVRDSYANGTTDEFVEPCLITDNGKPVATLHEGDAVLFFNFRTDRGRELTQVLTQQNMPEHGMHTLPLRYYTMARYDDTFRDVEVLYEKDAVQNGLGEVLAREGKRQIRIAETEKYPHVTFFFNGGRETPFDGEKRILCPSPKVATYDLQPEMSAFEIRDAIVKELNKGEVDFVCLNFANPDMVGHTGVPEAAIKACETVDQCTETVAKAALKNGYTVLITADHGNADKLKNEDGSPHTAHTTALVPLVLLDPEKRFDLKQETGKLGDLAPTILSILGIPIPEEMTGQVLAQKLERV